MRRLRSEKFNKLRSGYSAFRHIHTYVSMFRFALPRYVYTYYAARTYLTVVGMSMMSTAPRRAATAATTTAVFPVSVPPAVPVYFDHDGGYDDFVALVYLLKHQNRWVVVVVVLGTIRGRYSRIHTFEQTYTWYASAAAERRPTQVAAQQNRMRTLETAATQPAATHISRQAK